MELTVEISQNTMSRTIQKPEKRQSTPDSEALISSDDEGDRADTHWHTQIRQNPMSNTNRFSDVSSNAPRARKASFTSSTMSPTNSNLSTPSTDTGIWSHQGQGNNSINRGHSGPSKFAWSSGIWNTDTRIEHPPRLTDISSPSPRGSPLSPNNMNNKDQLANPTIPFPIPLHPTPKTYRSQSYSVGQLDPESPGSIRPHFNLGTCGRGRNFQHAGFNHRPSRPSMLSEMSNEDILANVNEVDDQDNVERIETKINGGSLLPNDAHTLEVLAQDRNLLKQQLNFRFRSERSTDNVNSNNAHGVISDELDSAIDELDDANENHAESSMEDLHGRRFSEFSFNNSRVETYGPIENRKLENVKKAFWQSSLGFGGLGDASQSRRHSFAEIPIRHAGLSSSMDKISIQDNAFQDVKSTNDYSNKFQDQKGHSFNDHGISYFDRKNSISRSIGNIPYHQSTRPCTVQSQYRSVRSGSPHNTLYPACQSRQNQPLTIVVFKSSRPDIFYIQEGTGLAVKPGDMVIVEADRGTDLGTVARTNIDWATAKELRNHYSKEHYTWLSINSESRLRSPEGNGANLSAPSNNFQASTPTTLSLSTQQSVQELNPSDVKPKLIKRLAQKHEIEALREKEGSETKAKHVCVQKVQEHGLHMDILDAEFQMDWKKLTFYYFADSYINFNSLVTDLFKIYKTRIWMSAINPASFPCSSQGFQTPMTTSLGVKSGPCMMRSERHSTNNEQLKSPCSLQATQGLQTSYSQQLSPSLDRSLTSFPTPPYVFGFSPYVNINPRNPVIPSNPIIAVDSVVDFTSQSDFRRHPSQFSSPSLPVAPPPQSNFRQGTTFSPNEAWMKSFLGLSMNSR